MVHYLNYDRHYARLYVRLYSRLYTRVNKLVTFTQIPFKLFPKSFEHFSQCMPA